jgi:hypothetical protein
MNPNAYLSSRKPDPRGPGRGAKLGNLFGGDKEQSTTTTNTNDSFNRFDTTTRTVELGDNTLSVGTGSGGASDFLPLILAAGVIFAGFLAFR